jgi:trigger factor
MADDTLTEDSVDTAEGVQAPEDEFKMDLTVKVETVGPCRKHVRVTVPRSGIDAVQERAIDELMDKAEVPGFRVGHVPQKLVEKRFKDEIGEQVKQKVLMYSLEQLAEEQDLDPINEPNIDLESIDIPDEGDFEYEFDVEVRPEFDLPDYKGISIERPVREISDEDVEAYQAEFLEQYGHQEPTDEAAQLGDYVVVHATFASQDKVLRTFDELSIRVRPTVRFHDAELDGFDELMVGAKAGDVLETELTISMEADNIAMRGEPVRASFEVLDVKRLVKPALDQEFFERINVADATDLKQQIRSMLERQVTYEQRRRTRDQVMESIIASAEWDLPEELVRKQTENALRREILEMRQAGFTPREIQARENDLRQRSVSMTRQNLKQHFILDKIAEEENIEVTPADLDTEIAIMSLQAGENPRRVRARLIKSGMIENLEAQVRERKAVDVILEHANFEDVELDPPTDRDIEAIPRSICSAGTDTEIDSTADED